ncbi:hypothetical protein [Coraliomargarita parva]|uniref:hypothetical protein n=1 Tax=Coraliomargarita parva TaxID=3014050 RepID=UPI0022B3D730|nr:hypothetical protein [Coraliomargarita parva]
MKAQPYESHWRDPQNWKCRLFYFCRADPRVIVPKRPTWAGRTLNFAHPKAYWVLLATFLFTAIPITLLCLFPSPLSVAVLLLSLVGIIVFYYSCDLAT